MKDNVSRREKRAVAKLNKELPGHSSSRTKSVAVTNLVSKSQRKRRRDQFAADAVEWARRKVEKEQLDDVEGTTLHFEGLRPMKLMFQEAVEEGTTLLADEEDKLPATPGTSWERTAAKTW